MNGQQRYLEEYEKSLKYFKNYIDGMNASGERLDLLFLPCIGYAYWKNGNLELADYYFEQQLERLNRLIEQKGGAWRFFHRAKVFAFRGMNEEALEDLREYYDSGFMNYDVLNKLKINPLFDNIRDVPEFQQILLSIETRYHAEHEKIRKWLEENDML